MQTFAGIVGAISIFAIPGLVLFIVCYGTMKKVKV